MADYRDEYGHHMGYCNACGEEAELGQECCEDGEVVEYDDDTTEEIIEQEWTEAKA